MQPQCSQEEALAMVQAGQGGWSQDFRVRSRTRLRSHLGQVTYPQCSGLAVCRAEIIALAPVQGKSIRAAASDPWRCGQSGYKAAEREARVPPPREGAGERL